MKRFRIRRDTQTAWHDEVEAAELVGELLDSQAPGAASTICDACAFIHAYMGLSDHNAALVSLEQGFAERANIMKFLKVIPIFDPLRGNPRFVELVRRVGLG